MGPKEVQRLINRFNKRYPVGAKVRWRNFTSSPWLELVVRNAAFDMHGQPVCFLEGVVGCVSIEPMFIDYKFKETNGNNN